MLFAPFLRDILSAAGFVVLAMLDALSLTTVSRIRPHVVLIDFDYLDIDSTAALEKLRYSLPEVTICAYTGRTDEDWIRASIIAGANCMISKAAEPSEIVESIQHAIQLRLAIGNELDQG